MLYKAKNIDTDKAEKYLNRCINNSFEKEHLEKSKIEKYYEGYRDGIGEAVNMFYCSDYEKDESEDKQC